MRETLSLPGRYAFALWNAMGAIYDDKIVGLLEEFEELLAHDSLCRRFCLYCQSSGEGGKALFATWLGEENPPLYRGFLNLLIEKRRILYLSEILTVLKHFSDQTQNQQSFRIRTAQPLTPQDQKKVLELLSAEINLHVKGTFEEDPALIAGFLAENRTLRLERSVRGYARSLTQ